MQIERRRRNYVNAVLVPLVAAAVTAWSEHRTQQNKERQDAVYAVTAPALRDMQLEQVKLAARVDTLTQLVSAHVMQHPRATEEHASAGLRGRRALGPPVGLGHASAGGGAGSSAQEQLNVASQLKTAPSLKPVQRAIPVSPDEALIELKK